jgi:hypothetical protein
MRKSWSETNTPEGQFGSERGGPGLEVESEAIYQHGHLFDHIRTVFLFNLAEIRALDEFAEEMAV